MCKIINVKQRVEIDIQITSNNLEAKETLRATPIYATNHAKIYVHHLK